MASISAGLLGAQALCGSAALGATATSRSLCCQCAIAVSHFPATCDLFTACQTMTTCKMGARKARAYQKKPHVKKVLGKISTPTEAESITMESGKETTDPGPELENGYAGSGVLETLPSNDEQPLILTHNGSTGDEGQHMKEAKTPAVESMPGASTISDDQRFIKIMEDLMKKVKDAEKNILRLNEARIQSMEQLEQARREKSTLQSQLDVSHLQLAEADIRVKAASQEKERSKFLEKEVEVLKGKLIEKAKLTNEFSNQDPGNKRISELSLAIESAETILAATEAEKRNLKVENQTMLNRIKSLLSELTKLRKESETMAKLKHDKDNLQSKLSEIEGKLAMGDSNALKLRKMQAEKDVVAINNLQSLKAINSSIEKTSQVASKENWESAELKEKVAVLEGLVSKLETDNKVLKDVYAENKALRNQTALLEQRLAESDAKIGSQLDFYKAEVEALQASIEESKLQKNGHSAEVRVDDMPREFWSYVLLSIDGWLLEKKLSLGNGVALREIARQREHGIRDVFVSLKGQPEKDIIAGLLELLKKRKRPGMHIVHIAAEMAPVAKVGGLGDVVTGLGKAFQKRDHLVEVVLPKYDCMDYGRISNLKVLNIDLLSYFDGHTFINKVWVGTVEGLPVYFIEPHHPARFFWRGKIYGDIDDFKRFTYFSRAALEFVLQTGKRPDIIHCHDWHTAVVAPLYWDIYVPQGLDSARIAFTCHNFEYQGTDSPDALASCGLDPQRLHRPDRMQDNFVQNRINLLKGAIVFSNIVTTVSPTYAQEVQSSEGGKGLHLTLMAQTHKFLGILNGIDTDAWNPATDLLIGHQYSVEDVNGKEANKAALRSTLRLSGTSLDSGRPIVGCITRLVPQKGVHLIRHAIFRTLELGGQFVLLGSSPVDHIQREFEALGQKFSQHPQIRLVLKYDEALSHYIYAGADIIIIPSIFEPCGLTQMIAMRYGAIPVARKTGGLNDSVFDVDDEMIPLQARNGFTFSGTHEKDLNLALDRAFQYFLYRKEWWLDLVKKAMMMDFGWNSSASQYSELYEQAVARARTIS